MKTSCIFAAASLALAAGAAATSLACAAPAGHSAGAYPGGVGRVDHGAGPAGRSSFRDDGRSHFRGSAGNWGFAHRVGWREGWRGGRRHHRFYGYGYPYYGVDDAGFDEAYAGPYESGGFGPEPPYGDSFAVAPPPIARPMAPALAPLAYGPGVHDGAYAYGFNGYAQTPALPIGYGGPGWSYSLDGRGCGC